MGLITGRQSHLVHPSSRLYNGECKDFRDAVRTYLAALRYECGLFTEEDEWNRESKKFFEDAIRDTEQALAQYEQAVGAAEQALFSDFAKSENDNLRMIGEAAVARDYSPLAL